MPNYALINLAPAVSSYTPGVAYLDLKPVLSEYIPRTASFGLGAAVREYTPGGALFPLGAGIAEYTPSFAVFGLQLGLSEWPQDLSTMLLEACQFSSEYPLLFTQTELTQPKQVAINLIDFSELGSGSLGPSMVFFGGCGFSVGDMLQLNESVWDEEKARLFPSLITTCADHLTVGAHEVLQ